MTTSTAEPPACMSGRGLYSNAAAASIEIAAALVTCSVPVPITSTSNSPTATPSPNPQQLHRLPAPAPDVGSERDHRRGRGEDRLRVTEYPKCQKPGDSRGLGGLGDRPGCPSNASQRPSQAWDHPEPRLLAARDTDNRFLLSHAAENGIATRSGANMVRCCEFTSVV